MKTEKASPKGSVLERIEAAMSDEVIIWLCDAIEETATRSRTFLSRLQPVENDKPAFGKVVIALKKQLAWEVKLHVHELQYKGVQHLPGYASYDVYGPDASDDPVTVALWIIPLWGACHYEIRVGEEAPAINHGQFQHKEEEEAFLQSTTKRVVDSLCRMPGVSR